MIRQFQFFWRPSPILYRCLQRNLCQAVRFRIVNPFMQSLQNEDIRVYQWISLVIEAELLSTQHKVVEE